MTPIPFRIKRSSGRETVALTIENDGKLVVTAPEGVAIDHLNRVVRHKAPWVLQRLRRVSTSPPPPSDRDFVSGETVFYLVRRFRLKVLEARNSEACTRIWAGWYHVGIPLGLAEKHRRDEVRRRLAGSLKERADLYLPGRLVELCRCLRLEKPSLIVRKQRKRWGSCDANGVLRINWRIVQAPIALIEYVLAHELTHLQHPKHGREFWAALGRMMPDYEARRARLLERGCRELAVAFVRTDLGATGDDQRATCSSWKRRTLFGPTTGVRCPPSMRRSVLLQVAQFMPGPRTGATERDRTDRTFRGGVHCCAHVR